MDAAAEIAADIPLLGDERRKNWARLVTAVDETKASGWAFEGEFIAPGGIQDVPAGGVVLVYGERGSRANPRIEAAVYIVNSDGTMTRQATARGRAWARTLRDHAVRLLDEGAPGPVPERDWEPGLAAFTDHALVEELERRGYGVDVSSGGR
jgi:hypothetical protein